MTMEEKDLRNYRSTGFIDPENVNYPPEERVSRGPVAVIECPEKIPCNPCEENCPVGAIEMEDINGLPEIDFEKCIGCSVCVESCPGLAIFTVDCSHRDGCRVTLPYEFTLPKPGEEVSGLNRKGEEVTKATVKEVKTKDESAFDTPTVTVEVSKEHVKEVRNIRRSE